jgi:hypothetical protein
MLDLVAQRLARIRAQYRGNIVIEFSILAM